MNRSKARNHIQPHGKSSMSKSMQRAPKSSASTVASACFDEMSIDSFANRSWDFFDNDADDLSKASQPVEERSNHRQIRAKLNVDSALGISRPKSTRDGSQRRNRKRDEEFTLLTPSSQNQRNNLVSPSSSKVSQRSRSGSKLIALQLREQQKHEKSTRRFGARKCHRRASNSSCTSLGTLYSEGSESMDGSSHNQEWGSPRLGYTPTIRKQLRRNDVRGEESLFDQSFQPPFVSENMIDGNRNIPSENVSKRGEDAQRTKYFMNNDYDDDDSAMRKPKSCGNLLQDRPKSTRRTKNDHKNISNRFGPRYREGIIEVN